MGKEPEEIRREIEDTRKRMAETLEALEHKTDMRAQAKEQLAETSDAVRGRLRSVVDASRGAASRATRVSRATRGRTGGNQIGMVVGMATMVLLILVLTRRLSGRKKR